MHEETNFFSNDSYVISDEEIRESNLRHDLQMGPPAEVLQTHIRSGWNEARVLQRGTLTDRKITKYVESGWYSAELKEARKTLAQMRAAKRSKRIGNFDQVDGRMIYRP
jgi:hypothetical protein